MTARIYRRGGFRVLAGLAVVALAATACGGSSGGDNNASSGNASPKAGCEDYTAYGDLSGKTVTVYTGIVAPEDAQLKATWAPFEKCTGATIKGEFDKTFEAQILVRAKANNLPDIGIVPQPGLLQALVKTGKAVPADQATTDEVDKNFSESWKGYGSVDGKFYAPPQNASMKSLVWYSPKEFTSKGYKIPTTLDELKALSDQIASTGKKPWCAGISSGEATGWPITDWMEDFMLRTAGPEEYDKWVKHEIPFNSAEPTAALDAVGAYLKNDSYVNGGLGNIKSIASTTFQDGGLPILQGQCSMHRQASFYAANWPEGTDVSENGDVFAFYLPPMGDEFGNPVLGGGEFVTAFADRPEVQAFQTYLSTDVWANEKAKATPGGGWVSANKGLDVTNLVSPIDQLSAQIFQDPDAVFRFDGSDQMPGEVGANSFWKEMTAWITGESTQDALDNIEKSWPSS